MAFNRFRIALVSLALGCVLPTAGHAERTHNVRLYFQSHKASDTVWLHYPMMIVNYVK